MKVAFGPLLALSLAFASLHGIGFAQETQEEELDDGRGDIPRPVVPVEPTKDEVKEKILAQSSPENYQPDDHIDAVELTLLFRSAKVQQELKLTRTQLDDLGQLRDQMEEETRLIREQLRQRFDSLRSDGSDDDERAKFKTEAKLFKDELAHRQARYHQMMKDVLLPFQVKSLNQITTQFRVRRTTPQHHPVLMNELLVEELGIDSDQLDEMQKVVEQSDEELKEIIAKHHEERHKQLLKVLTPEQRESFEKIFGTKIDF